MSAYDTIMRSIKSSTERGHADGDHRDRPHALCAECQIRTVSDRWRWFAENFREERDLLASQLEKERHKRKPRWRRRASRMLKRRDFRRDAR